MPATETPNSPRHRVLAAAVLAFGLVDAGAAPAWQSACPSMTTEPEDAAAAPALRHGRGLLWRVERDGVPANWLYGTMHVEDPRVLALPEPVETAFAEASALYLESRLDTAAAAEYAARMFLPDDRRLASFLPALLYARYIELARGYGVGIAQAERLTPWAALNLVGRPPSTGGEVLDQALERRALERGQPVFGIETLGELTDLLAALPEADQAALLSESICRHEELRAGLDAQVALYLAGELGALARLGQRALGSGAPAERFLEVMLYQRNLRMAERLAPVFDEGGIFAAVGALHLVGERGLLSLLESAGFRITRAY